MTAAAVACVSDTPGPASTITLFGANMMPFAAKASWTRRKTSRRSTNCSPGLHMKGELRVSNFLLYQIAYAEIWVTDKLWPDFRRLDLLRAIVDFQRRERRYGSVDAGDA